MLIEVHPLVHPDIVENLTMRFTSTHDVELVPGLAKEISDYSELAGWNETQAIDAMSEGRGIDPLWLMLRPHALPRP